MPVIAVVNRKGGSGKSTLATHLASHYANAGVPVMLGDVDRQQSTQTWLRARALRDLPGSAPIVGWAVDPKRVLRPPAGVTHVVLDTPGGLRGFDLARVAAFADVIVMPVCNSIFDRESAADCFAELVALPRVSSGRCKVAALGMRLDARTRGAQTLAAWARSIHLPFIGVVREAQAYVRCVEQGLTVFDLEDAASQADVVQWKPIVAWLDAALRALPRPVVRGNPRVLRPPADAAPATQADLVARLASNDLDGQGDLAGEALAVALVERPRAAAPVAAGAAAVRTGPDRAVAAAPRAAATTGAAAKPRPAAAPARGFRLGGLFGWLAPRFLHR
ncbi:MAG: ParA family protein [Rhizobacter sp.]|nr:ParA family protein [Rhizobacter sp.]